ncbi:PAS domain S-box [Synechococcus sp. PCC 7502]|uniref:PAS domain-containing hybrid sensor histidine kinase/response regulator n=1 Tax=Synechococcus sp. PCC 7502 TaxID=1173263 RepID=UPI00029F9930|nr:PAS domain S-box protein [Synechococcus sp. PCC 7502]AFY73341.1 PAS domain S-box [Synechococcus sp. PCC 7502]
MNSDLSYLYRSDFNSHDWYQYIAETVAEGIWIVNQDVEITFVNQKLAKLLGYSSDEMLGKSLFGFMDMEAMAIADQEFQRRLEASPAEIRSEYDFKFVCKDGRGLWAIVITKPLFEQIDQTSSYIGSLGMITNVTRRRQGEEIIREREEYYRLLAENSTDMVSCHGADTTFVYVSSMCLSLTGYGATELLNRRILDFIHPEDQLKVQLAHRVTLKHIGMVNRITFRFAQKNGNYIWLEMTKRGFVESGEIKVICSSRDIQQRKETEQALETTNSRLNLALSTSAIGTWEWDVLSGEVICSERTKEIFGYELNETKQNYLTFKNFMRSVHRDDRYYVRTAFSHALRYHTNYQVEFRVIKNDGKLIWIDGRGQVYCDRSNQLILVIGVAIDITKRKETEQEIKRQLQKELLLRQITEQIRFKFDLSQIFDTTVKQLGEVFNVSRCLVHTFEFEPEPLIRVVDEYVQSGYDPILGSVIPLKNNPHATEVMSSDRALAINDVFNDPSLSNHNDFCREINLKSVLVARTSYQGKPNGMICLHQCDRFRHWTEEEVELLEAVAAPVGIAIAQAQMLETEKSQKLQLTAQNQSLQESQQAAESANQAKSEFLAMMSHEIRTPMNAVIGITELLLNSDLSEQDKEHLEMIRLGGQSLITIINDILDFSKIESNKLELEENPLNLYECITNVVELLKPAAITKSLNLILDIDPQVPTIINGDSTRIKQILTNLLSNAIKFTQVGEVKITVTATQILGQKNLYEILFTIKDTGIGIPSHLMPRLFKPFSQVDASTTRQHGGTGLGLAISKKLCEMMGGKMWVLSRSLEDISTDLSTIECLAGDTPDHFLPMCPLEVGSTFQFTLGAASLSSLKSAPMSQLLSTQVNFIDPPLAASLPLNILLVEDNVVNQKVAIRILKRMGYSADLAENGLEAIATLQKSSYDVVFMDIQMPEMDGLAATKEIRKLWKSATSPYIIAMTANAMIGDREICLDAGMNDYVSKPISIEKIGNALAQIHL